MRTKTNRPTRIKLAPPPVQLCEWFLKCTNVATGTTPHDVLGLVPTCDRCAEFATGGPTTQIPALLASRFRS